MIKVLIVDDHQLVIEGMISLLESAEDIVCQGFANSGRDALNKLHEKSYDLVLLDINMPEMDGLKTCELILKQHPQMKVIALTMLTERSMIKAMVTAGAKGYLLKNVGYDELVLAIKRVYEGKTHYSDEIADILLQPDKKSNNSDQLKITLSTREKQILRLIIEEHTTSDISKKLFISINTVETHRRNIMNKLGAKNVAGMVRIAIQSKLLANL